MVGRRTTMCVCAFCEAYKILHAFEDTLNLVRDELQIRRIAFKNQKAALQRMTLPEKVAFTLSHPRWVICCRCDGVEEDTTGDIDRDAHVCYACDMAEHQ